MIFTYDDIFRMAAMQFIQLRATAMQLQYSSWRRIVSHDHFAWANVFYILNGSIVHKYFGTFAKTLARTWAAI